MTKHRSFHFIFSLLICALLCAWTCADNEVRIGADRYLIADNEPFFTIGAYAFPKGMTFEEGKEMGFNLIRVSANQADWDTAQQAGLKVWHSFGGAMDFESGNVEQKKSKIKKTVEQLSSHPVLLFWESMDEPAWTDKNPALARATPSGLNQGYKFLNSLDDKHPVYLNHAPRNTVETLRAYNPGCDIVCVDVYPIIPKGLKTMYAITPEGRHGDLPNQTPSSVGEFVDKMQRVANDKQAVFVVLQGFAWEALRGDKSEADLVLYPTYHESRFMAFNAVVHGANGLMVWGLSYTPKDCPFVGELSKVLNEIKDLSPLILGDELYHYPTLRYRERGSSIASGVELLCKQTEDTVAIITTNTGIDPAAVDFSSLPPELCSAKSLKVLGENRSVAIENGAFFDEFEGLDVHVYLFEK